MEPEQAYELVVGWVQGKHPGPLSIEMSLTRCCNLRCIYCNARRDDADDAEALPEEEIVRLVREAGGMGVEEITLVAGGESFFDPAKALRVMRAIKENGIKGVVTTNATLITEETVKQLIAMRWDLIIVSLDGPDQESNDFLRGTGCFTRVVDVLRKFKRWKEKLESPVPRIYLNTAIHNRSHTRLADMFSLAREMRVRRINLIPLIPDVPSSKVASLTATQMEEFRNHAPIAREVGRKLGIESNIDDLLDGHLVENSMRADRVYLAEAGLHNGCGELSPLERIPCYFPWYRLVIHTTGHVHPCINEDPVSFVGERSLKEVWENDPYLNTVRAAMLGGKLPKMCSICCAPHILRNRAIREIARSRNRENLTDNG